MILTLTIELPISLSQDARGQEVWALATIFHDRFPRVIVKQASDADTDTDPELRYSYFASATFDGAMPSTAAQVDYLASHPGYLLAIEAPRRQPVTGQLESVKVEEQVE